MVLCCRSMVSKWRTALSFLIVCCLLFLLLSTRQQSRPPILLCPSLLIIQFTCKGVRRELMGANCLCLFPTLHSVTLHWEPEIGHGGRICTMKISKCYKSGLPPKSQFLNIPQHTTECTASYFRKHIKQMKKVLFVVKNWLCAFLSPLQNHGKQPSRKGVSQW